VVFVVFMLDCVITSHLGHEPREKSVCKQLSDKDASLQGASVLKRGHFLDPSENAARPIARSLLDESLPKRATNLYEEPHAFLKSAAVKTVDAQQSLIEQFQDADTEGMLAIVYAFAMGNDRSVEGRASGCGVCRSVAMELANGRFKPRAATSSLVIAVEGCDGLAIASTKPKAVDTAPRSPWVPLTGATSPKDLSPTQAEHALFVFIQRAPDSWPELLKMLENKSSEARCVALGRLGDFRSEGSHIAVRVIPMLTDNCPRVRTAAAQCLMALGTKNKRVRKGLAQAMNDDHDDVRFGAADALLSLYPTNEKALNILLDYVHSPSLKLSYWAIGGLGNARIRYDRVIPVLGDALAHENDNVRLAAVRNLAALSERTTLADLQLVKAATNQDIEVRFKAVGSLYKIRSSSLAVEALVKALKDASPRIREQAAKSLGFLEERAHSALAALRLAADDRNEGVRQATLSAIKKIEKK
jgi:HEAT repeat protein